MIPFSKQFLPKMIKKFIWTKK